jgi:transposase
MFADFHGVIIGGEPDALNGFIDNYGDTKIEGFCNGLRKDIVPVMNAISMDASSGFVEGNNNKFKLIKRTLYGRAGLITLAKKCKLIFSAKDSTFSLSNLL